MSTSENNEKIDDDILQCKKDILRAKDIIPGASKKAADSTQKPPAPSQKSETNRESVKSSDKEPEKTSIPRFDLAEKILAEQRKIVAAKRKSPDKKSQQAKKEERPPAKPVIEKIPEPYLQSSRIIAEIVAQDIEQLLKGEN